ncbi:hypothetical protein [Pendulispora albinea]|uniref:Uncharacterized protein n=1 Tax=Pendulispora albinea TaxID=2741071 RepID=A0ABZ2M3G7_9BACT
MGEITTNLKAEIQKGLSQIQTLRDEVRVRLHLAGMEVKDEWQKLEPRVEEIERRAEEVTDATKTAVEDVLQKLSNLRKSLS